MKHKQLFLLFFKLYFLTTFSTIAEDENERWFDVEVILIQHLHPTTNINEHFSHDNSLKSKTKFLDLLTPYLAPDIRHLKAMLPDCNENFNSEPVPEKNLFFPTLFNIKPLNDITAISSNYIDNSVFQHNRLCKIPQGEFFTLTADNSIDYYGFDIDKVPSLINAVQDPNNTKAHLLNEQTLQLHDIYNTLKNSREFKPLLHLGWRQVARSSQLATPIKLYAGDNFYLDYKKRLALLNQQENKVINTLSNDDNVQSLQFSEPIDPIVSSEKTKVNEIINDIIVNDDLAETARLTIDEIETLFYQNEIVQNNDEKERIEKPYQHWFLEGFFKVHLNHYLFINAEFSMLDKALSQLTTDQLPLKNREVEKNKSSTIKAKPIHFKQFRRVISGEIHYFDHPYMGIIVQIRPVIAHNQINEQ